MDVSHIQDGFQHTPLTLTGEAIEALRLGLHNLDQSLVRDATGNLR
jgi:hypothetical protein